MKTPKIILTLAVLALSLLCVGCATMYGEEAPEEMRSFESVGEIPDTSQDDLFVRANQWLVDTFVSSEAVVEYQDKEAGELAGKYVFTYAEGVYTYAIRSTINISVRDGRYRFRAGSAQYKATSGMGQPYNNPYGELTTVSGLERAQSEWAGLSRSLEQALNKSDDF